MLKHFFRCACPSSDHLLVVNVFPEDEDDNLLYFEVGLVRRKPLWQRLLVAFKYVVMSADVTPFFVEVLLDPKEQQRLIDVVQDNLNNNNN